jgi:hypothetical protein
MLMIALFLIAMVWTYHAIDYSSLAIRSSRPVVVQGLQLVERENSARVAYSLAGEIRLSARAANFVDLPPLRGAYLLKLKLADDGHPAELSCEVEFIHRLCVAEVYLAEQLNCSACVAD